MIGKLLSLIVFFNLLVLGHGFSLDDKTVYEKRLTTYLMDAKSKSPSSEEDFKELLNFSKDFPDSKYADDVEFIYLFSLEASDSHKYQLKDWEALVDKNPNGQVSALTKSLFKKYLFDMPPMYVPYSVFLLNIKGDDAFWNKKDYTESADYYNKFLKGLDYSDALQKEADEEPYMFLLLSYINLKQKDDFDRTKAEFLAMFPDQSEKINSIIFN